MTWRLALAAICTLRLHAWPVGAQTPPSIMVRDAAGQVTVRVVRTDTPPRIDGRIDDALYATITPFSDFIQTEPTTGAPATEKTEVWLFFDRTDIAVSVKRWE